MNNPLVDQLIAGGWLIAALRVLFIGLVYVFLFLVWRATVRELHAAARQMPSLDTPVARGALVVIDPAGSSLTAGEALALAPATMIGRDEESPIVADDPHVSARHAEIRFDRGQWWLRDLDSSNGTFLNGNPVRAVIGIRPGDVIQCGRVRFRFVPSFPVPGEDG
jgi:pSer/pThr/pTyr-binding forkhead associated (FHA) protein